MKVLVCGGRNLGDRDLVYDTLDEIAEHTPITLIIEGGAPGADTLAAEWAEARGIHTARVNALWKQLGRGAGPLRNRMMLKLHPEMVVAFPGGRGTAHMVGLANDAGIEVVTAFEARVVQE